MHNFRIQNRWATDLCDAPGLRRRAAGKRALFDVAAPAEGYTESLALSGFFVGGNRRRVSSVFQTFILTLECADLSAL
jgi:hypothetical protein